MLIMNLRACLALVLFVPLPACIGGQDRLPEAPTEFDGGDDADADEIPSFGDKFSESFGFDNSHLLSNNIEDIQFLIYPKPQ
jgi:hypothetical protein